MLRRKGNEKMHGGREEVSVGGTKGVREEWRG